MKTTYRTTLTSPRYNRRLFLRVSAAATFAAPALLSAAPSRTLNIGCIGVGGKGFSDMSSMASAGHRIAAVCDIDQQRLAKAQSLHPKATAHRDWRQLLEQKGLDAVTVSTPDHTHAPATLEAIRRGLHTYTQKPLTHDVHESRVLTQAAKEHGVITQMGIQHHSSTRLQSAVELIQSGVIGKVREAHAWTDRPGTFWKQGLKSPGPVGPIPNHVSWDLWLGTAPSRPYSPNLHPFAWRGWWDFGTGALGDMGCHVMDPIISALELPAPQKVSAQGPPPMAASGPLWCEVEYEFPGTKHTTETLKLTWYEAGRQPDRKLFKAPDNWAGSKNGVLFIGSKGNLFVGFPEDVALFPAGDFANTKIPRPAANNHYSQWTDAILAGQQPSCPFAYSGPLTETVLLGNVAYRSGQTLVWNSETLKCEQADANVANQLIRRKYRQGWEVKGL